MRGTILAALVLIFAAQARAAEPPAVKAAAACTCSAAFDRIVEGVETDYAGYQIKVDAKRREAYEGFKSILKADAAGAGADRCKEVLDTFVAFFQDYHIFVLRAGKAGGPGVEATRSWTEREARAEIDRNRERLDPVEGLWYSKNGRYAVLHETGAAPGTFVAVRLAAGEAPSRDLAAVFRRTGQGSYQASFRDAQGRWQATGAALHRGGSLLVFGIEGWGRLDPLDPMNKAARLDPADPEAPLFARLDEKTLYLSLPSFMPDYRQKLDDIIAAQGAEIAKARGLIIDLRGNGGGDAIYYGLSPYLLPDGPVEVWEDNSILASPRNLRYMERFRAPLGDKGKIFDPAIQRMRESPGKLVPYLDRSSEVPPPAAPGPRRVVILTDKGVGSAAEGMLLLVRKSPRVILVGENTRGNIDYQEAVLSDVGCGDHAYLLGVPLYTRSRRLPEGGLDVIGITPDVPIPDHLADPLAFAVRLLAAGS
jgi:hypothetical protein